MTARGFVFRLFVLAVVPAVGRSAAAVDAEAIYARAGFTGGVVLHIARGDGRLTADLARQKGCIVHRLDTDPRRVAAVRGAVRDRGMGGTVAASVFDGRRLPFIQL